MNVDNIKVSCPICKEEFKHGCLSYTDKLRKKDAHLRTNHPDDIVEGKFGVIVKAPEWRTRGG